MKLMKQLLPLILIILATTLATGRQRSPIEKMKRLPLQKKQIALESPREYLRRVLRVDPKSGEEILYDPKPRVELLDAKAGKYSLKWIGYDGKEKVVVYQRPDAIDAIVSAFVVKTSTGQYVYEYTIQNLITSGEHLAGFEVQTFSSDITPSKLPTNTDNIFVGEMSVTIPEFKEGKWLHFATLPPRPRVNPGQSITFKLTSSSPPGLVMCRVDGGDFVMKGVGEEMPQELEDALPNRYRALPSGYTIGPIDKLKSLSPAERAKYVLQQLPRFKELGWMTADAFRWYQQNLNRIDLATISQRAEQDLGAGNITNEVLLIIQGIR